MTSIPHDLGALQTVCLCLRVDNDLISTADEWLSGEDKRVVRRNSENFLWLTTALRPELLEWIRAMGPKVEVMLPLSLREHMRRSLTQTLFQYRIA
jgi:predicted DNA-binding transcriptional regulator YafY